MPRNISDRLDSLSRRRRGTDRLVGLPEATATEIILGSLSKEAWQNRALAQPFTQYALGAMQEVGPEYTRIGIETAERVGKQLKSGLPMPVAFALQGSVPLNVHIRGVSDVDLLVLDDRLITYDASGPKGRIGFYFPSQLNSLTALQELRRESETLLRVKYPAATVDCTGGKCIAVSGGSLARPVDVVPSHWHETATFQASNQQYDRAVTILNKRVPITLSNLPFLHIKRVNDRDITVLGGLKKAIRLVKNVKNDAENETSAARLPSFDIAALMYHANMDALRAGYTYELYILQEAQRFFDSCYRNKELAKRLMTPDGSRPILDSESKFAGLTSISVELDTLTKEVAKEQNALFRLIDPSREQVDGALKRAIVPHAA